MLLSYQPFQKRHFYLYQSMIIFPGNLSPLLSSSFVNHELIVVDTVMMFSWLEFLSRAQLLV